MKKSSTFRLQGGGRNIKSVMQFLKETRDKMLHLSSKRLKLKAFEVYQRMVRENITEPDSFTASEGWLTKFLTI